MHVLFSITSSAEDATFLLSDKDTSQALMASRVNSLPIPSVTCCVLAMAIIAAMNEVSTITVPVG
eukprot:CAMPEP_0194360404 /NCGR_PEP_ID=MMETSP0174-20130528/7736_1 /TAXON_ID=216777 /ORGANISM="Proboscia alata, Strain PI-D3" /LENGTH=64 /DNA_ID=CAMNT_0039131871 /DNA_START=1517 /DNA_END=1711 /DNA_ORIENTATION=-